MKGDCSNGYGEFLFSNGNRYVGEFRSGKPDGQGILFCANGSKYLGSWSEADRHGEGKFIFAEGHEYQGGFHRNALQGKGVMRYANGDRYEGNWFANLPNGFGIYTLHTGDRYEGNFRNGKRHGEGSMFYKDGSRYAGAWVENHKHGRGIFTDRNGKSSPGEWSNGRPLRSNQADRRDENSTPTQAEPSTENPDNEPVRSTNDRLPDAGFENDIRIWAVVVGVASYTHMQALRYTDDDAYRFYAFLKSPEGGALPDEQLRVLVDENATRDNILDAMRHTFLQADKNDVILFYFSGHGIEGAFIPVDFDGTNNRLYHEDVREILQKSQAKFKLVLGDACHSGSLFGMNGQGENLAARQPVKNMLEKYYGAFEHCGGGSALLMSSKGKEVSLEDTGLRSGVFSFYLVRGLSGEADFNFDKIVSIRELSDFVSKKVSTYTAGAQTPVLTGNFDDNLPVAVVRN